eukprot:1313699-Pyramimonas_sp.AAC.1
MPSHEPPEKKAMPTRRGSFKPPRQASLKPARLRTGGKARLAGSVPRESLVKRRHLLSRRRGRRRAR